MSTNAERRLLPSLSSSAVLCRAVRAGQLSKRKKMTTTTIAKISAIRANAIGHATRCGFAEFDIRNSAFSVLFTRNRARADHDQEESGQGSASKNYRTIHPRGVQGGCSPHNNR